MNALSQTEFFLGLFIVIIGVGILMVSVMNWSPKLLRDEIVNRIQQSIAAIDACAQPVSMPSKRDSGAGPAASHRTAMKSRR